MSNADTSPARQNIPNVLREKPWTAIALAVGIVLIILFPLRALLGSGIITDCHLLKYLAGTDDCKKISGRLLIWWDIVAVVWTVLFSIVFFYGDFAGVYKGNTRSTLVLGEVSVIVALISGCFIGLGFWFRMGHDNPSFYFFNMAKLVPLFWIVYTDILIIRNKGNEIADSIREDFRNILFMVDGPALVAVAALLGYTFFLPPIDAYANPPRIDLASGEAMRQIESAIELTSSLREFSGFASGGAAAVLIFANIAFAIQFFRIRETSGGTNGGQKSVPKPSTGPTQSTSSNLTSNGNSPSG